MKRFYLAAIVSCLFLVEGTILQLILPEAWRKEFWIVPQVTLISILYISLYLGRKEGLIYGIVFGGLYDLVYGDFLGLFLFLYGFTAYSFGLLEILFHRNFWLVVTSVGAGSILLQMGEYGFFLLFKQTAASFSLVFYRQILPSSLINMAFVFLLHPLLHRLLEALIEERREQGEGGSSWKNKESAAP